MLGSFEMLLKLEEWLDDGICEEYDVKSRWMVSTLQKVMPTAENRPPQWVINTSGKKITFTSMSWSQTWLHWLNRCNQTRLIWPEWSTMKPSWSTIKPSSSHSNQPAEQARWLGCLKNQYENLQCGVEYFVRFSKFIVLKTMPTTFFIVLQC